jgi:primosomal protein N' (replication factor Y)
VTGWVVETEVEPPAGVTLLPLKSWLGFGPPPAVVELAEWAAWRWAGPASFFLRAGSPATLVKSLPVVVGDGRGDGGAGGAASDGLASSLLTQALAGPLDQAAILRIPPTVDLIDLVLGLAGQPVEGSLLVLVPSVGWARRLVERLTRRGYAATSEWAQARAGWPIVVGSRAAAWAPVPKLGAVLVLDAHDSAFREESAPTYSAVDVVAERARRAGCRCLLVSPVPPATVSVGRVEVAPPLTAERAGWAAVESVDRRGTDPRLGLFSEEFVRLARSVLDDSDGMAQRGPLVCMYDRVGRARLLACVKCGELARCTTCGAAMSQAGELLHCPRCGAERPCVCAVCGRLKMKTLRSGVTRLREELSALLGTEVAEVAGAVTRRRGDEDDAAVPDAPVLLGTKAVLYRARRASAVAFLDFDLHLLAPRLDATDEALALLVRASRLVGSRQAGPAAARVLLQTRAPDHVVVQAASRGEPGPALSEELSMRRTSGLPPFSALALISGTQAETYAAALREAMVGTPMALSALPKDGYLLRAPDHLQMCDLLGRVQRPAGPGLRVEVDPSSV